MNESWLKRKILRQILQDVREETGQRVSRIEFQRVGTDRLRIQAQLVRQTG